MRINWEEAINQIFAERLTCSRCGEDREELVAGYSRRQHLNRHAPRHRSCPRGDDCDARKLIVLCVDCARTERLHGTTVDSQQILETYLLDCRKDLEESLDYLAEYWRDDFDVEEAELDRGLDEIEPEAFREETEWRERLEEEYLRYHSEFRKRGQRIPHPGWRAEYVEEIRALGYDTTLGD